MSTKNRKKKYPAKRLRESGPIVQPKGIFERQKSWLSEGKALLNDRKFLLVTVPIGFISGISAQLSWIQVKCNEQPLLGSLVSPCKENLLRIIFGGPILILAMMFLASLLRRWNHHISAAKTSISFLWLLPLSALPAIKNELQKDLTTALSLTGLFVHLMAIHRKAILISLRGFFATPKFSFTYSNNDGWIIIKMQGCLFETDRSLIYDRLLDILSQNLAISTKLTINISQLKPFEADYDFVLLTMAAIGNYLKIQPVLELGKSGEKSVRKELRRYFSIKTSNA